MPIKVLCSSCGKRLTARDELAGSNANCPACGKILRVPGAAPASALATPAPLRPGPKAVAEATPAASYRPTTFDDRSAAAEVKLAIRFPGVGRVLFDSNIQVLLDGTPICEGSWRNGLAAHASTGVGLHELQFRGRGGLIQGTWALRLVQAGEWEVLTTLQPFARLSAQCTYPDGRWRGDRRTATSGSRSASLPDWQCGPRSGGEPDSEARTSALLARPVDPFRG